MGLKDIDSESISVILCKITGSLCNVQRNKNDEGFTLQKITVY
jgi:hypothetical protein